MIILKTPKQIAIMRQGGKILTAVLKETIKHIQIGITLAELNQFAETEITKRGAYPSFKKVKGYHWAICGCVNEVVVHGIPGDYRLSKGDVVGIDCGVYYRGFHTDSAWTVPVLDGKSKPHHFIDIFLKTGRRALNEAIGHVRPGNYIYDISAKIQEIIEASGYNVVKTLVGHGIGRKLHEDPEIPCFTRGKREETPKILPGMVLAIEVIYNMGQDEVVYRGDDEWTIVTKDGKISGLFEATVAVVNHGCIVLSNYGTPGDD